MIRAMCAVSVVPRDTRPAGAWYRDVTRDQWMAFVGSYFGWVLDGFDYTILTFLLVDVQRSFAVNATLAGLLGQVTLMFRLVGGIGAGTAADRWGRKGPLMFSILWYSLFAFLSGFSTSYGMLFMCRALFGIGMGGVWAAGMPLTLEHWPAHLRGRASGMMQSGYSLGFLLSALVFQFGYPLVNRRPDLGWRAMLWIGVLPALLVLFIMKRVKESPVWLERQRYLKNRRERDPISLGHLFSRAVLPTTLHTSIMMGAVLPLYHSITSC
jgi:SHS family lactate transporter-like MFS transporter